ncbi:hypothetical protein LJC35_02155 [Parabacteroides sp. OttesenSCG-928-N08]|nr:hypothetical protein [Parabacteroides sp. OttesenSCG-928-N08]
MNDKLKQFVAQHRDEFEDELLPEGHTLRFEEKLNRQRRPSQAKRFSLVALALAAAVALLLLFRLPFGMVGGGNEEDADSAVCELQQEVEGIQRYYQMQMNNILMQMEDLYAVNREPGLETLLRESKRVQQQSERFEEKILPALPCDEKAILVLKQHYGNSVESMQLMLQQMEQVADRS